MKELQIKKNIHERNSVNCKNHINPTFFTLNEGGGEEGFQDHHSPIASVKEKAVVIIFNLVF